MASRKYMRDSRGRFAGGGGAVTTTYGRAGGFASASVRAKAANSRAAKARRRALVRKGIRVTAQVGTVATTAALLGGAAAMASRRRGFG